MNSIANPKLAVAAEHPTNLAAAAELAAELRLPLVTIPLTDAFTHLLMVTPTRLELRTLDSGAPGPGPVYVDFIAGAVAHRRRFGGGRGQPLARAVGLKGGVAPTVADVTAGLGRDAFVLACLGCTVWLIERSPIIAVLLRDGLRRAAHDMEIAQIVTERLHLYSGDGRELLPRLTARQRPDVVYLDPMYPHRQKSAWAGKEMRLLRQLAGDDEDAPTLLAVALACAGNRVVVKRPRLAPALSGPPPTTRIVTPNTRFDLYHRVRLDPPAR